MMEMSLDSTNAKIAGMRIDVYVLVMDGVQTVGGQNNQDTLY